MKADDVKRLFKGIFSEDISSLKKIAYQVIEQERQSGHSGLAASLEKISILEDKKTFRSAGGHLIQANHVCFSQLPVSKRDQTPLVSYVSREKLRHHMVLPQGVNQRLESIEKEYAAKGRLEAYNLFPKRKILFYGAPGCGKTMSAERIAWTLGLPLLKVRFDALLSSYFGESAANLRSVFEYCEKEAVVLLLDECDFIARSRIGSQQDVGEVPRIVNMLLTLLDEYTAPGLVIATTNLKITLDEALFRRFDDVLELPMPQLEERKRLLMMTLSSIPVDPGVDLQQVAEAMNGYSYANVVLTAQRAAKTAILSGSKAVQRKHFDQAFSDGDQS